MTSPRYSCNSVSTPESSSGSTGGRGDTGRGDPGVEVAEVMTVVTGDATKDRSGVLLVLPPSGSNDYWD